MSTSASQQADIPALGVLQFDAGSFGSAVNLFRGNLAFPLKLLTLPARGGLAFDLTLLYQSNVADQVSQWNLTNPSGALGVGWSMPLERIVAETQGTGSPLDVQYYLMSQGQAMQLVPIPTAWSRGTLPADAFDDAATAALFASDRVPAPLASALERHGWRPSGDARIASTGRPDEWRLDDAPLRRSHLLRRQPDGTITVTTDGQSYETAPYQFWQITHYPAWDSWEVVRPDGTVATYGGSDAAAAARNLIQWGIRWGNWVGPSRRAENQQRYALAWNLAQLRNTLGHWIEFSYSTIEQAVGDGTLTYTRECQIASMENDLGWSCRFAWQPMTYDTRSLDAPKEYLAAHGDPAQAPGDQPNAWQDRYETRYLDHVDVIDGSGAQQTRLDFDWYDLTLLAPRDAANPLATGACYKRYLKGVTDTFSGGAARPGIAFDYNFDADGAPNPGAMTSMTLPTGGVLRYTYAEIDVGADENVDPGSRNLTVDNPFGASRPGAPRIWYGADYVVVAWYEASENALLVNVYTWLGRWISAWTDWQRFDGALDLDRTVATTSADSFMLLLANLDDTQSTLYLASRRPVANADWHFAGEPGSPTPYRYDSTQLRIANGADFFVVIDDDDRRVDRYALNWQTRDWDVAPALASGTCCPSGSVNTQSYVAAATNHYLVFCYDEDTARGRFSLMVRDAATLAWRLGSTLDTDAITIPAVGATSYFQLSMGQGFAAAAWIDRYASSGGVVQAFDYRLAVLAWDDDYGNLALRPLPDVFDGPGFTNLSPAFMQTLGPVITGNSLIGSGPNVLVFDGVSWSYHFAGIQYAPGSDANRQFYWYAWDQLGVLKTENTTSALYAALDSFDPDADTPWVTQVLQDEDPAPADRETQGFPTLAGTFLSQNRDLYGRSVWPAWNPLAGFRLGEITVDRFDSTTVINQAPDFLAFMTLDADGAPLDTQVRFFCNGGLLRDAQGEPVVERFPGQQMFRLLNSTLHYETAISGKLPAIPSGFVTFPSGNEIDASTHITLHRYANHSLHAPLAAFVVTALAMDSGYDTMLRCYAYADVSANTDPSGSIVQFSTVSEYQACETPQAQRYGWTTSHFYNGLPARTLQLPDDCRIRAGVRGTAAPVDDAYSLAAGLLLSSSVYDRDGTLLSSTTSDWTYTDQVASDANGATLRNLYDAVPQIATSVESLQGVARTMTYAYNAASGYPATVQTAYYDSRGELNVTQRTSLFGFEVYPAMWSAHILAPVASASTRVQADGGWLLQAAKAQTFRNWAHDDGTTYLAEADSWVAVDENAPPFAAWNGGQPGAGWLLEERIDTRDGEGNVLLSHDVTGRPMASLFDDAARFRIAGFVNSASGNAYDSFEDYQRPTWSLPAGAAVYRDDAASGTACLQITASATLTRAVTLTDGRARQLFGLWFKSPPGATASDFTVTLTLTAPGGAQLSRRLAPTAGQWQPQQWTVDPSSLGLGANATVTLGIRAELPAGGAAWLRLDDVFFTPLDCQFQSIAYDGARLRTLGTTAPNGVRSRTLYNPFAEPSVTVGPWDNPSLISMTWFAAQDTTIGPAAPFPRATPNAAINVNGQGIGIYDGFCNGALAFYTAASGNAADWSAGGGLLSYHGEAAGPLGARLERTGFAAASIAARVLVDRASLGDAVLGTGTWFVGFSPAQGWRLWRLDGANPVLLQSDSGAPAAREWLLVAVTGRVLFFADGLKVFEYADAAVAAPFGIQLGMTQPGSFSALAVAEDVGLSVEYRDGLARSLQTLKLESADSAVLDTGVYDDRGNTAIRALTSRVTVSGAQALFVYQDGLVTNGGADGSLWQGAPLEGALAAWHPDAGGYPFARTVYENAPLGRPVAFGQPGYDYAIRPGSTHYATRGYGVNADAGRFAYPLPIGEYHLTTDVDPNGAVTQSWSDTAEHLIGRVVQNALTDDSLDWRMSQIYDAQGRTIASVPPASYAAGGAGTKAVPAGSSTADYDFAGHRLSSTDPDSGTTQIVYSSAGLMRFLADGNALNGGYIAYRKYDTLSRVIEEGTCAVAWDRAQLQQHADDPDWPPSSPTWSVRRHYDGDGSDATQDDHLAGRLWKVEVNQGDAGQAGLTETVAYDRAGRVLARRRQFAGTPAGDCVIANTWSAGGNLLSSTDSTTGLVSLRRYDALGRLLEVAADTGGTTTVLIAHEYEPNGKPALTRLLPDGKGASMLSRRFAYTPPGWPTVSDAGGVLRETLAYDTGACEGGGYYNGEIARQTVTSDVPGGSVGPACTTMDSLGQLTAFGSGADAQRWEIDLNGNFERHTRGADSAGYTYAAGTNRLTGYTAAQDTTTFAYDHAGGIVGASDGAGATCWQIGYDAGTGRPVSYAGPGASLSILRDADGNRAALTRTSGGATSQRFQTSMPDGELMVDAANGASAPTRFIAALDVQVAWHDGRFYFALLDHLGSVRVLLDASGETVGAWQYDVYGQPTVLVAAPFAWPRLFTGHNYDADSGFYDCNARFYHPGYGRYLSVDPMLETPSPYVYVGNNPLVFTDPSGMNVWGIIVGALVTLAVGVAGVLLLGTGIGAAILVGVVAGAVGSMAGDLMSMATGDQISWKQFGIDALAGAAAGAAGALAGGGAGALTARAALGLSAGKVATTLSVSLVSGIAGGVAGGAAGAGVTAGMTGQPFFSRATALNIAIGAVAGGGAGLMAAGAHLTFFTGKASVGVNPTPLENAGEIPNYPPPNAPGLPSEPGQSGLVGKVRILMPNDPVTTSVKATWDAFTTDLQRQQFAQNLTRVGNLDVDVVATHGISRSAMVEWTAKNGVPINRPTSASTLARFLRAQGYGAIDRNFPAASGRPIKLVTCFAGMAGRFSFAQALANELQVDVYAHWWVVYPTNNATPWIRFQPR
ncbi:hypothetical protein GJG85_32330 [Burkholderia sp. MS389]|uniref:RHS repeat domain-containing protein n=1 Tax=Burkholderia sp. MS389 TaxID=2811789 RepID=UPI00195B3FC6|nr:RHS repeat-associated core domain-containing protein [Burkholderia sp. MS389]QRR18088.1 hypothetical protein GJG85_32330 [Burkholderia sp. MS389]